MQADVPRAEWREFFDRMSKALTGKWAEIAVASSTSATRLPG